MLAVFFSPLLFIISLVLEEQMSLFVLEEQRKRGATMVERKTRAERKG